MIPNGKTNADILKDFSHAEHDRILLDNRYLKKVGKDGALAKDAFVVATKAKDAEDRIVYDKAHGALYYDPDGSGHAAAIKLAALSNKAALALSDFLVGVAPLPLSSAGAAGGKGTQSSGRAGSLDPLPGPAGRRGWQGCGPIPVRRAPRARAGSPRSCAGAAAAAPA